MKNLPVPTKVEDVDQETVYKGFFRIDVHHLRYEKFDGEMSNPIRRELFERGDAVALLPYDPVSDTVVMIRQFLPGAHYAGLPAWPLQIVAGMVDKANESTEDVARREAVEEAGLTISEMMKIGTYLPSPGGATEVITLYCAIVDSTPAGGVFGLLEENENIQVEVVPALEAINMVDRSEITPSTAVIALHWLARNRDRLRGPGGFFNGGD